MAKNVADKQADESAKIKVNEQDRTASGVERRFTPFAHALMSAFC